MPIRQVDQAVPEDALSDLIYSRMISLLICPSSAQKWQGLLFSEDNTGH